MRDERTGRSSKKPGVRSIPGQGEEHEPGEQQNVAEFQKMMRGGRECVVPYCPEKAPVSPSPYLIIALLLLILPIQHLPDLSVLSQPHYTTSQLASFQLFCTQIQENSSYSAIQSCSPHCLKVFTSTPSPIIKLHSLSTLYLSFCS